MSLRKAIDAKCKDCIHDAEAPGTWREQVAQCSAHRCPLWPYRPEPGGGPFVNPPRDPATVSREWLAKPVGEAVSGLPPPTLMRPLGEGAARVDRRSQLQNTAQWAPQIEVAEGCQGPAAP